MSTRISIWTPSRWSTRPARRLHSGVQQGPPGCGGLFLRCRARSKQRKHFETSAKVGIGGFRGGHSGSHGSISANHKGRAGGRPRRGGQSRRLGPPEPALGNGTLPELGLGRRLPLGLQVLLGWLPTGQSHDADDSRRLFQRSIRARRQHHAPLAGLYARAPYADLYVRRPAREHLPVSCCPPAAARSAASASRRSSFAGTSSPMRAAFNPGSRAPAGSFTPPTSFPPTS